MYETVSLISQLHFSHIPELIKDSDTPQLTHEITLVGGCEISNTNLTTKYSANENERNLVLISQYVGFVAVFFSEI